MPLLISLMLAIFVSIVNARPLLHDLPLPHDLEARSKQYSGELTFYSPEGNYGACGTLLNNGDSVVAFAAAYFDQHTPNGNPNQNTLCGRHIEIRSGNRNTVVTVADRCEACVGHDVDVTPPFFEALVEGGLGVGRTQASWRFID